MILFSSPLGVNFTCWPFIIYLNAPNLCQTNTVDRKASEHSRSSGWITHKFNVIRKDGAIETWLLSQKCMLCRGWPSRGWLHSWWALACNHTRCFLITCSPQSCTHVLLNDFAPPLSSFELLFFSHINRRTQFENPVLEAKRKLQQHNMPHPERGTKPLQAPGFRGWYLSPCSVSEGSIVHPAACSANTHAWVWTIPNNLPAFSQTPL